MSDTTTQKMVIRIGRLMLPALRGRLRREAFDLGVDLTVTDGAWGLLSKELLVCVVGPPSATSRFVSNVNQALAEVDALVESYLRRKS